jgi:NADPH:quinone reductase
MTNMSHVGAWIWSAPGTPMDLSWRGASEWSVPTPGEGDLLIAHEAIGLNPVDWKFIAWGREPWRQGQVPGVDGVGRVVGVGAGVTADWIGQRVAYHQSLARHGSFSTHSVVAARAAIRVPPGLTPAEAATMICPLLTALQALDKLPPLNQAEVLVTGAGGGVGHWLLQLGARAGWHITAMARAMHDGRLRELGAQQCVADSAALDQQSFAAAVDCVSGTHAASLARHLGANSHLVCIQDRVEAPLTPAFEEAISVHEVALNALHRLGTDAQWRALTTAAEQIMGEVVAGELKLQPHQVWSLAELRQGLVSLQHHRCEGRPVVSVLDGGAS